MIVKSSREAKPAPKRRPMSAAVTADAASVPNGFGTVSLLDHHPGQCRWLISDVRPVVYFGGPVADSSSRVRAAFEARLRPRWRAAAMDYAGVNRPAIPGTSSSGHCSLQQPRL
jgi:hypothetical protein